MKSVRVPFSGVGFAYGETEIEVVSKAMRSTDTLTQGKYQHDFEDKFAKFLGVPFAYATSSAATAIELAAILFNVGPEDEVIVPAHTYAASAYPFARHGAKMIWADIDPDQFIVTLDTIKPLISEKTKVVVLVHLYGLPVDTREIVEHCKNLGIYVLEDCAQAVGATVNNELVGSLADISVFSFQSHKNISTLGEGGMIAFSNPKWAEVLPGLRHNGHRPFEIDKDKYWSPAMSDVEFDLQGIWPHNFCLGEIQCALGSHLLGKVSEVNQIRRERFNKAVNFFSGNPKLQFQSIPEHKVSAHHLIPFKFNSKQYKLGADTVFHKLNDQYGIRPAKQYYPLYRYGLFSKSGNGKAEVPITDHFYDNMVSLPFHHWMPDEDFDYMLASVASVVNEVD
jgi:dTDP-4-amino-4,6-dideoxygalactose transaminase